MAEESFEFSPRLSLVLANIKVLRQVSRVVEEECSSDIKRLLKYLDNRLRRAIPDFKLWNMKIEEDGLYFWPDEKWDVVKDDGIGMGLAFKEAKAPLRMYGDPWAGIYVPDSWSLKKQFKFALREAVPDQFLEDWEGSAEDSWPIWTRISLLDYSNDDTFDKSGFIQAIEEKAKDLFSIRPIVEKVLKEMRAR